MDAYLVLTPLLVLGIIALIRFIGCNWVFGLDATTAEVLPVENLLPLAGDARVRLSWTYPSGVDVTLFKIDVTSGLFVKKLTEGALARSADVMDLTNGTEYDFTVVAEKDGNASVPRTVPATPGVTSFVIDQPPILGSVRNNLSGFVGMEIMVGSSPIIVTQLGRIVATTNSGVHEVKIVRPLTTPVTGVPVAGMDVASASVTTVAQANVGTFAWTPLPHPVTLEANMIYFIVSSEIDGGDLWYEEQPVPTTAVATLRFSIFTLATGPDPDKYQRNSTGLALGPVSFRY